MATKRIQDLQLRSDFDSTCSLPVDDASQTWRSTGAQIKEFIHSGFVAPTVQRFTSGSGTYTTPAGVKYIKVRMAGGGAGGSGGGSGGQGGAGGDTTFGSSLLTAAGAPAPTTGVYNRGVGGTPTVNSPAIPLVSVAGGEGSSATPVNTVGGSGGAGGVNAFGGAGGGGNPGAGLVDGGAGAANTGAGGGGGQVAASLGYSGAGGGAGAYIEAVIYTPGATYGYAVGAGGAAGSISGSGAGGAGGSGVIIVEEFYQ